LPQPALDNLVHIGQLKAEARNELEVRRLLAMARTRLADAGVASISAEDHAGAGVEIGLINTLKNYQSIDIFNS